MENCIDLIDHHHLLFPLLFDRHFCLNSGTDCFEALQSLLHEFCLVHFFQLAREIVGAFSISLCVSEEGKNFLLLLGCCLGMRIIDEDLDSIKNFDKKMDVLIELIRDRILGLLGRATHNKDFLLFVHGMGSWYFRMESKQFKAKIITI